MQKRTGDEVAVSEEMAGRCATNTLQFYSVSNQKAASVIYRKINLNVLHLKSILLMNTRKN